MSLNIISLAGLILALGMMIDSSIIVTENISQYRERGYSLRRACVTGTSEVVTPMLRLFSDDYCCLCPADFYERYCRRYFL